MSNCELCGREGDLVSAFVETVKFKLCSICKKFGKVVEDKTVRKIEKPQIKREEIFEDVVSGCGNIIKKSRESRGLSQHDLAFSINEMESVISKIEQNAIKPSIVLARKLEKFFGINLVIKEKILEIVQLKNTSGNLTIGDYIKKDS